MQSMREEKSTYNSLVCAQLVVNEDDPSSFATDSNLVQSHNIAEKMKAMKFPLSSDNEGDNLIAAIVVIIVECESSEVGESGERGREIGTEFEIEVDVLAAVEIWKGVVEKLGGTELSA